MVMQSLRTGTAGGFLKYILFGLLGMAMGGLVVMDVRGVLQGGGVGGNDVAKIEDKTISIQEFDGALRRNLARYRISVEQAAQLGVINEVLTGEIRARVLEHEAETLGIDLSQKELAKRVAEYIKPYSLDDESLQQTLNRLLQTQRMSEQEFVSSVKREVYGDIMMNAVRDGYMPDTSLVAQELYEFQKQTRDVDILVFPHESVILSETGSEEEKTAFYNAIKHSQYVIPEYRTVEVAILSPDDMNIDVQVEESELKEIYNTSPDTFIVGEQLVISQAMVQNQKDAQDIYELTQSGTGLKEAMKKVTGSDASFFPNVSFETTKMLPAIVKAVEERTNGKVYPPVQTTLGHHVVRLDKILPPAVRPFDEIKAPLAKELMAVKKEEEIFKYVSEFEQRLDDGESFEDIKTTTPITIISINSIDKNGQAKDGQNALIAFDETLQASMLSFILESEENQIPLLQELDNGKFAAIRVTNVEPSGFKAYEDVKDDVNIKFIADKKTAKNEIDVRKSFEELNAGGITFELLAQQSNANLEQLKQIPIAGNIPAPLVQETLPTVFKTPYDGYAFVPLNDAYGIMKIVGYSLPEKNEEDGDLAQIQGKLDSEAKDEAFLMYLRMLNEKYDTTVNDALINRVYKTN